MTTDSKFNFAGIPVVVSPYMPKNEVWLVQEGEKRTVYCHEGPQAGQDIEEWIREPRVYKIVNLGEPLSSMKIPMVSFGLLAGGNRKGP